MPSDGDDVVANNFRDPNYQTDISTGGGEDYIWTHIFKPVMHIDGGAGFDFFEIPDGWLGNFTITKLGEGSYLIDHGQGDNLFYVTNVELIRLSTFSGTYEIFDDPFFTDGNDFVDFNNLTDLQTGLFNAAKYLGGGYEYTPYFPNLYFSGAGNDTVYLPDAEHYVIHDNGFDAADRIWSYSTQFDAGAGDDHVYGSEFGDTIQGGEGDDDIWAGAGNDTIRDNPFSGDFDLVGGWIDGGAGTDTVQLSFSPSRIVTSTGEVVWNSRRRVQHFQRRTAALR